MYRGPERFADGDVRDDIPPEEYRVLRRRLMGGWWALEYLPWIAVLYCAVQWGSRLAAGKGSVAEIVVAGGVLAVMAWVAYRTGRMLPERPGPEVRDELLRMGRCPFCAYSLRDVTVEEDGCRVCPECGGAWRVDQAAASAAAGTRAGE